MFLPGQQAEDIKAVADRREGIARVEEWSLMLIPESIRKGVIVSVQEFQCGDPECSPTDTAVTILFPSGVSNMLGIPMEAKDIKLEHVKIVFPPHDVLIKWHAGEDVDWPPLDEEFEDNNMPTLRFLVGQRVDCRVGPDPVTGWATGTITQLWYHEASWPPESYAPYQIQLDDGRKIFAPQDVDQVIRSALPDGWTEHRDQSTGRMYYFNSSTGSSLWERPVSLATDVDSATWRPAPGPVTE